VVARSALNPPRLPPISTIDCSAYGTPSSVTRPYSRAVPGLRS
jgi:hypothetical protein